MDVRSRIGHARRRHPKPAGTGDEVSARIYNLNPHGHRARERRGSERRHTGTGEGISARIHVANSHGDRTEEGERSDRRHSANSLWERDDSCTSVGASMVAGVAVADARVGGVLRGSSDVSKCAKLDMFERRERTARVGITPLITSLVATPMGCLPRVKRGGFMLQRATKPAKD